MTAVVCRLLPAAHALLLAAPVVAQDREAPDRSAARFLRAAEKQLKWNIPAEPLKIVGPIWFVGTKGLGCWLITTSDGHILLNTGMPPSGPLIEASMRERGLRPEDIRILLAGHAHVDHVGGHAYIRKLSGAQVVMMEAEKELLESGGAADFQYGAEKSFRFEPVKVDRVLRDGEAVELGDVALTALHTPGHTRGSTTFIANVFHRGVSYKVVFPDGAGINPGYRLAGNPSYPGIADDYRRTLSVLEQLHPDFWLPAHLELTDFAAKRKLAAKKGVRAWIDPKGYARYIKEKRNGVGVNYFGATAPR